jgi:hypothetical protein
MSRNADPQNPQSKEDVIYLAQRDMLSDEMVEQLGGRETIDALLRGEDVKLKKPRTKGKKAQADEPETEDEGEDAEGDEEEQAEDAGEDAE